VFGSGEALAVMTMRGTGLGTRAPKRPDDGESAVSSTERQIAFTDFPGFVGQPSPTH